MTSTESQKDKGVAFRELHAGGIFVMANVWDAGGARLLSAVGFRALATTSAGLAFALGRPDGSKMVSREETLANAWSIATATDLPVSGDLESCFGATGDEIATTINRAAEAGLVGGSIEDATADPSHPVFPFKEAVARVASAAEAAHALPFPFTLTARAENYLYGRADLDDTIRRLQGFAEVGADVLFAPGLPDLDAIRRICEAVDRPVNVLATAAHTVADYASCGVRRVSLGSGLSRAALGSVRRGAQEVLERGTFSFGTEAVTYPEANALMNWGPHCG